MNRYEKLFSRLDLGEVILIDGATGTEIERRGVPQLNDAWNGGGALSDPNTLRDVHEDYINCGAKVIISNTFATHRSALEDAGEASDFEAYNRRGVEIACEARERTGADDVLVAGGMSYWSWSGNKPPIATLHNSAREQANILANAGADFLMLEMMVDIDRMVACMDAALETDLPLWVGLTCGVNEDRVVLRNGDPLNEAVKEIQSRDVPVINVMHTVVDIVDESLTALRATYDGVIGVYAHSGSFEKNLLQFDSVCSPDTYQAYVEQWLQHNVQIVGGCCGIGPDHIRQLSRSLLKKSSGRT